MQNLSNDQEDRPNQHENSHKLCNEMVDPVVNMMESQWKLRQRQVCQCRAIELARAHTRQYLFRRAMVAHAKLYITS